MHGFTTVTSENCNATTNFHNPRTHWNSHFILYGNISYCFYFTETQGVRHLIPTVLLFNLYPVLMYFQLRVKLPYINIVKGSNKIFTMKSITFLNPISPAYSLKHWRHRFKPYLRINPCLFEQARLKENI